MNTLELLNSYKDGNISTDQLRQHLAGQHQDENRRRPLSEGQKGLWMLWKSAPDSWAYNVPVCFKTENRLDTALFQRACTTVFAQHRLLNNEIEEIDGVPWQFINQQRPIRVDIQDLSALDEPAVIAEVQHEARRPFQLINGPLARVSLFELGGQSSIVLFTFHHIIFDGGSAVTLLEALARAYGALSRGETPICPSLVPGFYDFVDEERQLLDGEEG
ncbi:MAG: condensation domain-containing protein, partial [Enterobacter roggenkampii]